MIEAVPILTDDPRGQFLIWDEPQEKHSYVVGIDIAEGKVRDLGAQRRKPGVGTMRDRPDFCSSTVIDESTAQHVASWHGYVEPSDFAIINAAIGLYYNEAHLVPEINGPGLAHIDVLTKGIGYHNTYLAKLWNQVDVPDNISTSFGWRTTQVTRPLLIARIHEWLGSTPWTRDAGLIRELRTMEYDTGGIPRAHGRNKDDRVISLGLALQGRYELLHVGADTADRRVKAQDTYTASVWARVKQAQAASQHARSLTGGGFLPRGLGPGAVPRW